MDNIAETHFIYASYKVSVALFKAMVMHNHIASNLMITLISHCSKITKGDIADHNKFIHVALTCIM
jgi:hypothetical protein